MNVLVVERRIYNFCVANSGDERIDRGTEAAGESSGCMPSVRACGRTPIGGRDSDEMHDGE